MELKSNLSCSVCNNTYVSKAKLQLHIRRSHSVKKHKCPDCGKMFILLNKLKIHYLCHVQFSEFLCSVCGKGFKRRDKLRDHLKRIHCGVKETKFDLITPRPPETRRYRYIKVLEDNMRRTAYNCSVCGIGFNRRGILVNHVLKIHSDVPLQAVPELSKAVIRTQRSFKCHVCNKVYMSNGKRKSHLLKHHPDYDASQQKCLNDTKAIASFEIEPKSCSLCSRQFLTNAKLLQHERKVHNWQRQVKR